MHKRRQPVKLWYLSSFFRHERAQAGPLPRSSGRSAPRRSAPRTRPSTPSRSRCSQRCSTSSGVRELRLRLSSLGSPRAARDYRERLQAYLRANEEQPLRGRARAHRAEPAARVRLRSRRHPRVMAGRAAAARAPQRRGRRALRAGLRAARCRGRRLRARPDARARPRLLHADRVRVHLRGARRAERRRRRRTLRRPRRAARRAARRRAWAGPQGSSGSCSPATRSGGGEHPPPAALELFVALDGARADAARGRLRFAQRGACRRPRGADGPRRALAQRPAQPRQTRSERASSRSSADGQTTLKDMQAGEQQPLATDAVVHAVLRGHHAL